MKLRLEWTYILPKHKQTFFMKSDWMTVQQAILLNEDLEKTGRLQSIEFLDEHDSSWTKKELLAFLKQFETEPHNVTGYIDGGFDARTGLAGIGMAIYFEQHHKKWRARMNDSLELIEDNNEAEYAALYRFVQQCGELGIHHQTIQVYSDSMIVVNQASGEWPCYEEHYLTWLNRTEELATKLGLKIDYELIERTQNKEADQLATQALQGTKIESKQETK